VATKGLKVTAVKATSGRSATSVHVEVEPDELKRDVGEFDEVRSVSARIPEESEGPGHVRWRNEPLRPAGAGEKESGGRRRTVKQYFNVHYGPTAAEDLGVGLELETDRGKVKAPPRGQGYTVKDDSHPGESELKKRK
jgi:hypothetical protein